ncbi:hypothetical protein OIO90_004262 [Microbotryomycetes sp. JL221]|nr:hypothetical protein OIO90_004262 [Microbotryomycetes sp. JL221]
MSSGHRTVQDDNDDQQHYNYSVNPHEYLQQQQQSQEPLSLEQYFDWSSAAAAVATGSAASIEHLASPPSLECQRQQQQQNERDQLLTTSSLYQPYLFAYSETPLRSVAPTTPIHPFPATDLLQGFPPRGPGRQPYSPLPYSHLITPQIAVTVHDNDDQDDDMMTVERDSGTIINSSNSSTSDNRQQQKGDNPVVDRRVKCDRGFPMCERCVKRREQCRYPDHAHFEAKQEQTIDPRVRELEAKLATVQQQLKESTQSRVGAEQPSPPPHQPHLTTTMQQPLNLAPSGLVHAPYMSNSPSSSLQPSSTFQQTTSSSSTSGGSNSGGSASDPTTQPTSTKTFSSSQNKSNNKRPGVRISDQIASSVLPNPTSQDLQILKSHLELEQINQGQIYVGYETPDAKMSKSVMADALTYSLLDASARACCSRLPSLKHLINNIQMYKHNLHRLDPAGQLGVAVLCSLGARAAPHSALLGVPTHTLSDGTATPALYLTAGERREKAVRALESRANEIAWAGKLLQEDKWSNLTVLGGLTQLLIFEEARAKQSRFFSRNSIGMFIDLCQASNESDFKPDDEPSHEMKKSIATSLLGNDLTIGPRFQMPCQVSSIEIQQHFTSMGVRLPDVKSTTLSDRLRDILSSQYCTRDELERALIEVALWVCAAQWKYTRITCDRDRDRAIHLDEIVALYNLIDSTHSAIQNLQQYLVGISHIPAGCEGDIYALDHFVLLGVRADTYLVDLVNLIQDWLIKTRTTQQQATEERRTNKQQFAIEGDDRLIRLRWESMLRVRKCLKLIAFYSQLYLASSDKHVVHHIAVQLELLPGWIELACQRMGSPGGPVSNEFELTEQELDWIRQALELACYFTPLAGSRLQEFCQARERHQQFATQHEQLAQQPDPLERQSAPSPNPTEPSQDEPMPSSTPFGDSAIANQQSPYVFESNGLVLNREQSLRRPLIDLNDQGQMSLDLVQGSTPSMGHDTGDTIDNVSNATATRQEQQQEQQQRNSNPLLNHFKGQNWMDFTLGELWNDTTQQQQQQPQSSWFTSLSTSGSGTPSRETRSRSTEGTSPSLDNEPNTDNSNNEGGGGLSAMFKPFLNRLTSSERYFSKSPSSSSGVDVNYPIQSGGGDQGQAGRIESDDRQGQEKINSSNDQEPGFGSIADEQGEWPSSPDSSNATTTLGGARG